MIAALPRLRTWIRAVPTWVWNGLGIVGIALLPALWIPNGYLANGNDTSFPNNPQSWLHERFFMWNPVENGGTNYGSSVAGMLWHATQSLFAFFTHDPTQIERAFLGLWLVISAISIWTFLKVIVRHEAAVYVGTALYLFNPFVISGAIWENASASNIAVYAVGPALLCVLILMFQRRLHLFTGAALFGLISLVGSPMGMLPPIQYAALLVFAAFCVSWKIVYRETSIRRMAACVAACGVAFFLVNIFWIIPLALYISDLIHQSGNASLAANGLQQWLGGISKDTSLFIVARLLGAWDWFDSFNGAPYIGVASVYLRNPVFIVIGTAISAAAFTPLFVLRSNADRRLALVFSLTAMIALIFAAGAHPPTGFIFVFLYHIVPGMQVVRSPWYMFEGFALLFYAPLVGLTIARLCEIWPDKRKLIFAAALTLIAIYGFPMFNGAFLEPFRPTLPPFLVRYPGYTSQTAQYLEHSDGRYAFVPFEGGSLYYWTGGTYGGGAPITTFMTRRPVAYGYSNVYGTSNRPFDILLRTSMMDLAQRNPVSLAEFRLTGLGKIVAQDDYWYDWSGPAPTPNIWKSDLQALGVAPAVTFGRWELFSLPRSPQVVAYTRLALGDASSSTDGTWAAATAGTVPIATASKALSYWRAGILRGLIVSVVHSANANERGVASRSPKPTDFVFRLRQGYPVTMPQALLPGEAWFYSSAAPLEIQSAPGLDFSSWSRTMAERHWPGITCTFHDQLLTVRLTRSMTSSDALSGRLPLSRELEFGTLPVISAQIEAPDATLNDVAVVANLVWPSGERHDFYLPIKDSTPIDIVSEINERLSRLLDEQRRRHAFDEQWQLAHREPLRAQYATGGLSLELSKRGGVAPIGSSSGTFVISDVALTLKNGFQPVTLGARESLSPASASWSGISRSGTQPSVDENGFGVVLPQRPIGFIEYQPSHLRQIEIHDRYGLSLADGKQFNAEVLSIDGDALVVRLDGGAVEQLRMADVRSIGVPDTGGRLTISRGLPHLPLKDGVIGFAFSTSGATLDTVVFRVHQPTGKDRLLRIAADPYGVLPSILHIGTSPDMELAADTAHEALLNSGAPLEQLGPASNTAYVDVPAFLAHFGIATGSTLDGISVTFAHSSYGLVLGYLESLKYVGSGASAAPDMRVGGRTLRFASTAVKGEFHAITPSLQRKDAVVPIAADGAMVIGRIPRGVRRPSALAVREIFPTEYYVDVPANAGRILAFDQSFDAGWRAQATSLDAKPLSGYFYALRPDGSTSSAYPHIELNGYQNGWVLPEHHGALHVIISFQPQRYMEVGEAITAAAIALCVLILLAGPLYRSRI